MTLSNDLISQFVKATNDSPKNIIETVVYGTVQEDTGMVLLDGSSIPTPVTTSVVLNKGDRVTILLKNHEAIVTGNTTSPAPRKDDVLDISANLYYKLNTDGATVESEQTDENSLNGTIIKAKSITASKISVTDLQEFGATIGGFKISENSLYSGVKSSPTNTTRGIYLGSDGQLFFGDATNYLKYIIDSNGNSKLQIAADNITIGNESGVYNGLRMIVGGSNENLCGRDEDGRYIFGNNGSIMHYRAKNVDTTTTGDAFKFTSGNDIASNNTTSIWLFGAADSTSRYIGSYMAYNRTYSSAGNMYVTANGIFGRSASSSERYKEDITIADLSCFSGLYNLPVKKFKYKSGYVCGEDERCGQYLYGFIAEDLENIMPCAVDHITDENGNTVPEMWNSNIIIPALLKLIQDLNNRVKVLEGIN